MDRNPLRVKLSKGEAVWGTFFFEFGSPAAPRIMQAAGWDYILSADFAMVLAQSRSVLGALRAKRGRRG